jgi:MYXO-CTERM domain-containing protein
VYIKASAEGTQHLPGTRELEIIEASAKTWNDGTASCSFMRLVVEKPEVQEVGRDNVNLIKFRDTSWCRPATGDDPMRCHSESAAGLTTATYVDDARSARDGAIVDADIEMNGVTFAIAEDGRTQGTAPCQSELQNTLTHELGHLLGLEHPCRTAGDPARVDNNGAPVPACGLVGNNPVITEATMYNFQDCGEQKKETLSPDDTAAVCAVYPKAEDPGACDRVGEADSGCCRVGRGSSGAPLQAIAGAIGLAALLARRRRQPRATSHPAPRG